jgi:tetratricopeptide (TPR) repeat protein
MIGRDRPVLMVLDDLQSAKPVLLDVVNQVVERVTGAAVVVLGLGRPEVLEASGSWCTGRPNASSLTLGPLSDEEVTLLVGALSEVVPHRAGLAEQIAERAEGNPFFLEQLVAMTGQSDTGSLPPTVQSVIAARLDLLAAIEREVLLRAAVPGRRFSTAELGAVLAEDPALRDPPDPVLGTLSRRRLIAPESAEDEYRFSGVLVRDVAYNTLAKRDRQRFHEALARWYRRHAQSPDQAGLHLERAYRLAAELRPADRHHLELRADAAETLASAGARALRRSDLPWAADLLARALDLHDESAPGRKVVGVQLAEAGLLLGTDPHARDTLRTLAAEAWLAGDRRTAYHARLLVAALEPPGPSADEEALAAVPIFEAAGDHLGLTRAWLRVAQLRQLGGRYGEAEVLLRYALRHALQTEAYLELATVIGGLATGFWRGPTPVEAALAGCRALLAAHAVGRRVVRATVNCPYAVLLAYRGEYGEARALVQDSIRIIEQLGHVYGAATMLIFAAAVEGLAGQWDAAEALLRDAVAASSRTGDALAASAAAAALARALLEQGKDGATLEAAEGNVTTGDPFLEAEIHGVRARALAARGDGEQARTEVRRAAEIAAVTDSTVCQATAELDRAHVLRTLGDAEAATEAAAAAERLFAAKGHLVGVRSAASFGSPDRATEAP